MKKKTKAWIFPGIDSNELKAGSQTDIYPAMFIAALATVAKMWRQKCPSTHKWVNKMWSLHTMAYHSALKRRENQTCARTRMNLEDLMLRKTNQSRKEKHCDSTYTCSPRAVRVIETQGRMVVARGCGKGESGVVKWAHSFGLG